MNIFKQSLKDLTFIAFDLETTGLFAVSSEIIEIGAIKFNLKGELERFQILIDPQIAMPLEAFKVHGISSEMLAGKVTIEKVLPDFLDFIKDSVLIAHNAMFEASFISYHLNKHGFELPNNILLDTIVLSKKLLKDSPDYKLSTITKFIGIENSIFHRALNDAYCCMKIFTKIVEDLLQDRDLRLEDLANYNKPINFHVVNKKQTEIEVPENYLLIKDAVESRSKLKISYKRFDGEISDRDITPINFIKLKNKIYLEAYCHLREERRNFKLSKILTHSLI